VLVGGTVVMVRHGENYVGIAAEFCLAVLSLLESIMLGSLAHPASKQKSKVPCPGRFTDEPLHLPGWKQGRRLPFTLSISGAPGKLAA
jgi:hypothetical protein